MENVYIILTEESLFGDTDTEISSVCETGEIAKNKMREISEQWFEKRSLHKEDFDIYEKENLIRMEHRLFSICCEITLLVKPIITK